MDRIKLIRDTKEIMATKKISAFRALINRSKSKKAATQGVVGPNFWSRSNYARSKFGKALCLHVCARTLATQARKREAIPLIFLPSLLAHALHFSF